MKPVQADQPCRLRSYLRALGADVYQEANTRIKNVIHNTFHCRESSLYRSSAYNAEFENFKVLNTSLTTEFLESRRLFEWTY